MIAPSGSPVVERVLAIVEKAFDGDPPALAVVDFTSGASTTLSRGSGHVRLAGAGRVLSLDGGSDPDSLATPRRLVGGVVAADRVELMPLSAKVAPVVHARAAEAPPVTTGPHRRHPRTTSWPRRAPTALRRAPASVAAWTRPRTPDRCTTPPSPTPSSTRGSRRAPTPPSGRPRRPSTTCPAVEGRRPRRRDHLPARPPLPRHLLHGAGRELPAGPPHPAGLTVVPGVPPARRAAGAPSRAASRARRPAPPDR